MQRPTKEKINELPLYIGLSISDIYIVENEQDAKKALTTLKSEKLLGFDTESKPIFKKGEVSPGPSLIQLATETKAFLFPVRFPVAVAVAKELLSNSAIQKVGFGIKDDSKALRHKLDIEITNVQDLSVILKKRIGDKNTIGARAAVAMVLERRLSKSAQKSNWGAYPLQEHQILYAANDAHAAICVESALMKSVVEEITFI